MERNMTMPAQGIQSIRIRLAWAHLDILSDDMEEIQLLVAGDDNTVQELSVSQENGMLNVEQPQFGLSLNITSSGWMQVCLRLPRKWCGKLEAGTISGSLCARTVATDILSLETVSGSMHVQRVQALEELNMRTVSGALQGGPLSMPKGYLRTVSGQINVQDLHCPNLRTATMSGRVSLLFAEPFESLDMQSISGGLELSLPSQTVKAQLRSLSGKLNVQNIQLAEEGPTVTATSVSAGLWIKGC